MVTFFCVISRLQPHSAAILLLCDQRTPAEQPQILLLGGVHCKSQLSLSLMAQVISIPCHLFTFHSLADIRLSVMSPRFLWSWKAPRRSLWSTKHLERYHTSCVFDTFTLLECPFWLLLSESYFSAARLAERRSCRHSAPCGSLPRLCNVSPAF